MGYFLQCWVDSYRGSLRLLLGFCVECRIQLSVEGWCDRLQRYVLNFIDCFQDSDGKGANTESRIPNNKVFSRGSRPDFSENTVMLFGILTTLTFPQSWENDNRALKNDPTRSCCANSTLFTAVLFCSGKKGCVLG